jgi:hypothetical protein
LGAAITEPKVRWISDAWNRHGMANQGKAAGLQSCNRLPILAGGSPIMTEGRTYQANKGGCSKPRHRLPAPLAPTL